MANAYDRARAQLSGGGELALEAMDEYQLLEVGRKVYECARGLMRNPVFRQMIQEEAARIREEEAAACL
jgi:hypothetical protein